MCGRETHIYTQWITKRHFTNSPHSIPLFHPSSYFFFLLHLPYCPCHPAIVFNFLNICVHQLVVLAKSASISLLVRKKNQGWRHSAANNWKTNNWRKLSWWSRCTLGWIRVCVCVCVSATKGEKQGWKRRERSKLETEWWTQMLNRWHLLTSFAWTPWFCSPRVEGLCVKECMH